MAEANSNPFVGYVVYDGFEKKAIDSQVLASLIEFQKHGVPAHLFVFEGLWTWFKTLVRWQGTGYYRSMPIPISILPLAPKNFNFKNTLNLGLRLWLNKSVSRRSSIVLYADNPQAALMAQPLRRFFKSLKIILGVRSYEESLRKREEWRSRFGFQGRFVVVFSGEDMKGPSAVKIPPLLRIMKIEPTSLFLCLTNDPVQHQLDFSGFPHLSSSLLFKKVPFDEIPHYLSACDAGLLLMAHHDSKRYFDPVNLAEYLAAGLYVIAAGAVPEVVETIQQGMCGAILTDLNTPDYLRSRLLPAIIEAKQTKDRIAHSIKAAERFNWAHHLEILKKWYVK